MTWLHTWCGLLVGWVLFAIFFAGTLAVFRHEIDYWMTPELHQSLQGDLVAISQHTLQDLAPGAARWVIELPTNRVPLLRLRWPAGPKDRLQSRFIDSEGRMLAPRDTAGGSMLYRFHYGLLMGRTGMWMVGALAMAMLVALLTGIIIHAKIFREFFTFRPFAPAPRAWLDAHTLCSVAVLPFSLMITYSGLVIWWFIWMPGGLDLAYGGERAAFFREMAPPGFSRIEPAPARAPLLPLSQIAAAARDGAPGLMIASLTVTNPGRADARVDVTRVSDAALWGISDRLRFDGASGALLERLPEQGAPAFVAHRIIRILHEIKFAGPALRWVFFAMAAVSCAAIATGTVLWGAKRRARHAKAVAAGGGSRLGVLAAFGVDALNAGVIAGLFTATGVYLAANRLISAGWSGRADLETGLFFGSWLACAVAALLFVVIRRHAFGRFDTAQAAIRQLWGAQWAAAALVALALLPLDQLTTGGIAAALLRGDAIVLGVHGSLLAAALMMAWAAWHALRPSPVLGRR